MIIDAAKPSGAQLSAYLQHPQANVSIISRIETLVFQGLTDVEDAKIKTSLKLLPELPMDDEIATRAVALRRQKKMNLGDAIIAAIALEYGVPLVTRNEADFKHIAGVGLFNPFSSA